MSEEVVKVFISYSWDSNEHKDKVLGLAQALRDDGVDCTIDQFVIAPDNWDRWMLDQVDESEFVLIVCSERYYRRYRGKEEINEGLGVTWESTLIMGRLYDAQGRNSKFYPIFFDSPDRQIIPDGIRTSFYDLSRYDLLDLDKDENRLKNNGGYKDLYRLLTNQPLVLPRKVGSLKKLKTVDREEENREAKQQAIETGKNSLQELANPQAQKEAEEKAEREEQRRTEEQERVRQAEQLRQQAEQLRQRHVAAAEQLRQAQLNLERANQQKQAPDASKGNYTRLEDFLKAKQWQEADQETAKQMYEVMGRQNEGWLRVEDLTQFPCADLRTIDQLWVKYSQGKFGFSVQKRIWEEYGSPTEYNSNWEKIGETVGWKDPNGWVGRFSWYKYEEYRFDNSAPQGHLPSQSIYSFNFGSEGFVVHSLFSRKDL